MLNLLEVFLSDLMLPLIVTTKQNIIKIILYGKLRTDVAHAAIKANTFIYINTLIFVEDL
jgi:hypothetical protein